VNESRGQVTYIPLVSAESIAEWIAESAAEVCRPFFMVGQHYLLLILLLPHSGGGRKTAQKVAVIPKLEQPWVSRSVQGYRDEGCFQLLALPYFKSNARHHDKFLPGNVPLRSDYCLSSIVAVISSSKGL
jgi:hypothetical protein